MDSPSSTLASSALEVRGLHHAYGKRTVLADLTFTLDRGAFAALLGPNGSGKTTFFRILTTLLRPEAGKVSIFGHDVATSPAKVRSLIGVVFQHPAIDPQLSALENLSYHAKLYGIASSDIRQRSIECLNEVDLADRASDKVKTFSGGMKRRLEIAKAILPSPQLLLLDEPDTGLDPGARQQLRDLLLRLVKQRGTTILTTTHLMEMADVADRVMLLHQGKLLADATPVSLCARVGGDVLSLEVADPQNVAKQIASSLGVDARVVGQRVRIEKPGVHADVPRVIELLGDRVKSLSVARPTLNDVFLKLTGEGLDTSAGEASP
jgi:ABC-2 type transport system ATP-binding protein